MKTTTHAIATVLLIGLLNTSYGQGFYIETNSSYNFSLGSQELFTNSEEFSNNNMTTGEFYFAEKEEQIAGSYGQGFQFGLGVGYMFTESVGFELKAEQQLSNSWTQTYEDESYSSYYGGNNYSLFSYESTTSASMTRLTPSLILQVPGNRFSPYAQIGAIIGFGRIQKEVDYTNQATDFQSESMQYTLVMNGGVSLGLNGELGVNIKFTERISLNTGLTFSAISYAPSKGEITAYSVNGEDVLSELTTNEREVDYVTEHKYSSDSEFDTEEPYQAMKPWFPFSNVGLNFGIKVSL